MYRHLFKLIWNKRKQNSLLMSEILVSFLVIFAVFTLLVYNYQNYRKPMGVDYENVWVINYDGDIGIKDNDSINIFYETLRRNIKSMPEVKEVVFSSNNIPFAPVTMQNGFDYNNKHISHVNSYTVEDSYKDVLNLKMAEGRWFNKTDAVTRYQPVIINRSLKEVMFGREGAVGKVYGEGADHNKKQVIGVVEDIKFKGDYAEAGYAHFVRADTASFRWLSRMMIKVTSGADATFEGRLYKLLAGQMKNSNIEIEHLANKRKNINYFALVPMIVLSIVSCFLIINVALGLFGVLWYNISRRRGEIGLRRAIGATGKSVSSQLVMEAMILTTFSLIIGTFFAIQFPLLNVFNLSAGIYLTALGLSVLFIYLLVMVCAFYPGKQAAAIYPAVALHEE
ncbi:putative ABC transport system permease protein [Chitinophaga sp. CF118]|uniref:ABC transporter permease n=1 Tax=Chitinophaga sp. CF118 TaxID=1884367 RepID=UPI0008E2B0BD|nr:FtsX-like permease family protein [Chitinophaga sp. CF118]SFD23285.1 putative ABC transport system permease protein [Chitinophaga sp. CF118]